MKTIKQMSMTIGFCLTSYVAFSQSPPQGNPPANNVNARATAAWYRGGNLFENSPNNIFGTMWNSPIYTYTNGRNRMRVMAGGTGVNAGRIGFGNNLPTNFNPIDRLHLHHSGKVSPNTNAFNGIRITNGFTGVLATDGSQFGISNNGTYFHRQFELAPIIFELHDSRNASAMTNWLHIANNQSGIGGVTTDGFIGLNNSTPLFHLDLMTPFINSTGGNFGGELFISARPTDVPNSNMGMLNIAGGNGVFAPSLFGNLDASQSGSALLTIAAITSTQDVNITTNSIPVQRFIVGKDWGINTNVIDPIAITNRNAFSWQNVNTTNMLMNANGRLKIQTGLNPAVTIDNRLVITSAPNDPGAGLSTTIGGSSGLQLTNLTATTPPLTTNPGTGVLGVDASGNVVYVNAGSIGNVCGTGTSPLTTNWEIPLNNNTFIFSGQNLNDRVGIGTACNPLAKLHVLDNTGSGSIVNTFIQTNHSNNQSFALVVVNTSTVVSSVAGLFSASSANKTHAIVVPSGGGNVGFGTITPNPTYRLEVNGGTNFNGSIFQNGGLLSSDQNLKTNIDTISSALTIINQLIPKTFFFDTTNVYGMNFTSKKQYGFIAQDVELVLPELVDDLTKDAVLDSSQNVISQALNYKALNYNAFIAILMKGVQEQQNQIDSMNMLVVTQDSINTDLEDRLATLEACINNIGICNNNGGGNGNNSKISTQTITLENLNAIVLDQNLPNPFAESTQINYVIPDDVLNAKLLFYDMNGRIINEVNINERGNGSLTVYGENLEKGIYTYSLIADGKLIATKKMVKK